MMRIYLSVVLLLCLAIQFAPLSLIHSHNDHAEIGCELPSSDADDYDGVVANDADHESSDEDCHICEIQQSLNNQAYTLSKQASVVSYADQTCESAGAVLSVENYLIENTTGRAPPRA